MNGTPKRRSDFMKHGINSKGRPYSSWTKEGVRSWVWYVLNNPETAMKEVHLHLIAENIKLAALMFSTPAGPATETNYWMGTCDGLPCHDICYAIRTEVFRPSAMLANMENALMLRYDFDRAVEEFAKKLAVYDKRCRAAGVPTMVRWHQSGEFTPEDSILLDTVAGMFNNDSPYQKQKPFYGYTKREEYYCKYYNHPLINILWSGWRGMPIPESVLACGPLKAFFVEFKDGNNEYMAPYIDDKKRLRKCPGLIKGEFACNRCRFACAGDVVVVAKEH